MQFGYDPTRGAEFVSAVSMSQVGGLKVTNVSMSPQTLRTQGRLRAEEDVLMVKMNDEGRQNSSATASSAAWVQAA